MNIDCKTWRSTSWIIHTDLPPRFGIVASNYAESANSMFEPDRSCNWLRTVDIILDIMIKRIATKNIEYKDKKGIVPSASSHIKKLYDACAGFGVYEIDETKGIYKVNRTKYINRQGWIYEAISHEINVVEIMCTCEKWKDLESPCIDALAYYRKFDEISLDYVLDKHVSSFYSFKSLQNLFKGNICPVIIPTLIGDNETLPPGFTNKRKSIGRPRKQRLRKRSKFPTDEEYVLCAIKRSEQKNLQCKRNYI